MKRIPLMCPVCSAVKLQKIPAQVIEKRNQNDKGIVAIMIPENTVCPHLFVVYVDQNFTIRDAVSVDGIKDLNRKKFINVNSIDEIVSKLSKKTINKLMGKL
jgi:hypothetical protein